MPAKPTIAIVGPGRLGSALALALVDAGYRITHIVARRPASGRTLARSVGARVVTHQSGSIEADIVWLCVPDPQIASAARSIRTNWRGRYAFHSSGALGSDALDFVRRQGAKVASVHPFMTFVHASTPSSKKVPFGLEGDVSAVREARRIVNGLGGEAFNIRKKDKMAYHAWATFASPLLLATLATAEQVAHRAGFPASKARRMMELIAAQTLKNYIELGAAGALSGPIVRGDATMVRAHLKALRNMPEAAEVYRALARSALRYLPTKNQREVEKVLRK